MVLKPIIMSLVCILTASFLLGCSNANKTDNYGAIISERQTTKVKNIITKPNDFEGKAVKVEGQIVNECPGGHWFYLKDDNEIIYVNLSGFILPQRVGKTAVVEGSVINENGKVSILGKGVEIK